MIKESLTCARHWPVLGMVPKAVSCLQGKLRLNPQVERTDRRAGADDRQEPGR